MINKDDLTTIDAVGQTFDHTSACQKLAREILERCRAEAADVNALHMGEDEAASSRADYRLPVDKAIMAIQLAYCVAPHFKCLSDLLSTTAFVMIRTATSEEALAVGHTLAEAVAHEGVRVSLNAHRGLREGDRFVVISDSAIRSSSGSLRAIADAAERCLPLFAFVSPDGDTPAVFTGVDLDLTLPKLTNQMLQLLFEASHNEVPSQLGNFALAEELTIDDLVSHVRRGRGAADCLAGLEKSVRARRVVQPASAILLDDLAGYGEAKTWGLELSADMNDWRKGLITWGDVDHRAVVLTGPPGTGKTSFATVLAATLRVPLVATSVAEWNGRDHLSGTLKGMQAIFDQAIAQAPCVLFIDELDGISSRNAVGGHYSEYWIQLVNRMLELVTKALLTEGIVIVGATNHVERIDPALLRSGRLDQVIRIELPDAEAIAQILQRYVGLSIAVPDLPDLAERLVGQSGADIEMLVRAAKAGARRAGRVFSVDDLNAQIKDPFEEMSPKDRRRIAVYRNGQKIVAQVLGLADMMPCHRHQNLRSLLGKGLSSQRLPTEQVCNDVLTVILAGRAAEEIVFGDVSLFGAGNSESDLATATAVARELELKTGFGEMGAVYLGDIEERSALSPAITAAVRRRIESALSRASSILLDNVGELDRSEGNAQQSRLDSERTQILH